MLVEGFVDQVPGVPVHRLERTVVVHREQPLIIGQQRDDADVRRLADRLGGAFEVHRDQPPGDREDDALFIAERLNEARTAPQHLGTDGERGAIGYAQVPHDDPGFAVRCDDAAGVEDRAAEALLRAHAAVAVAQ